MPNELSVSRAPWRIVNLNPASKLGSNPSQLLLSTRLTKDCFQECVDVVVEAEIVHIFDHLDVAVNQQATFLNFITFPVCIACSADGKCLRAPSDLRTAQRRDL